MSISGISRAFVFGCGYLGYRVAQNLVAQGCTVSTLTRSVDKARRLTAAGIEARVGDLCDWRDVRQISQASHVLFAVGYDGKSGRSREEVQEQGLRNALRVTASASRFVYISTTGVYHQTDHVWVDERSPTHPTRSGARAHLRGEQLVGRLRDSGAGDSQLTNAELGSSVVLRMAGLYGPGRVPRLPAAKGKQSGSGSSGEPARRPGASGAVFGDTYLNLIHIDDAVQTVLAAWQHATPAPLYAVADGHPALREAYYRAVADWRQEPPPAFQTTPAGQPAASKRIWTARMRRELVSRLQFPSYREGLRDIFADQPSF